MSLPACEATKMKIVPPINPEKMTAVQLELWRASLNPNDMGFDGAETVIGNPAEDWRKSNA